MEGDTAVVANYIFRGIEYGVTMNMLNDNELQVEVEDRQTTDQWRGKFDTACEYWLSRYCARSRWSCNFKVRASVQNHNSDPCIMAKLTHAHHSPACSWASEAEVWRLYRQSLSVQALKFAFHLTFFTKRIMANHCCNAMVTPIFLELGHAISQ